MIAGSPLPDRVEHVLLDRDGVLNREAADGWISTVEAWIWERGAEHGLDAIAAVGAAASIVTNQSGIGRGIVAADDVEALHVWLADDVRARGVDLVGVFACPHAPEGGCSCRKPLPGLLDRAIYASGIDRERTVMVGDDLRDLEAASATGVAAVLVRTGKGRSVEAKGAWRGPVAEDLAAAVSLLNLRRADPPGPA